MKTSVSVLRFWPLVLLAPIALSLWLQRQPDDAPPIKAVCATLATGCTVQVNGREIRFGMSGNLKPLAPFQIWLQAAGINQAEARFVMEGMDMGFNLYTLHPDEKGVLRANVTLPICVTGRRDWAMILDFDKIRLSVPFVTDL